jgi:hypothetical protein
MINDLNTIVVVKDLTKWIDVKYGQILNKK